MQNLWRQWENWALDWCSQGRGRGLSWNPAARGEENPEPGLVAVPAVWAACHCLWGLSKQLCEDSGPLCAGVSKTSQHLSASEVHVTSGL